MARHQYADEIATAIELIEEFGRPMTLRYTIKGEPDPDYLDYPGAPPRAEPVDTPVEVEVVGVQTSFSSNEVDGTLIQSGDVRLLFDARVPIPQDARIDGFAVVNVEQVRLGEPVVLQKVQGRN